MFGRNDDSSKIFRRNDKILPKYLEEKADIGRFFQRFGRMDREKSFIRNFFQTEADSSNLEELTEISAFIGNFFQNIWKK